MLQCKFLQCSLQSIRRQLANKRSLLSTVSSSSSPVVAQGEVPAIPIDFWTAAKIEGEESHAALVTLRPGERLRAESGAMLFMTEGVVMDTKLLGASAAFSRFLTGQNVFLTDFHYEHSEGEGTVGLGTDFPSKILRFSLEDYGGSLICQRGAFLASNPTVTIETEFTKSLTAGFFGGQGFILQRLTGEGDVLVKGGGTIVWRELGEGEILRVTSGSIVAFSPTVQYEVGMLKGVQNVMFGGEGLFVTTLQGPGQVWLQGMPPDRMIAEIARRVPGPGIGLPIGFGSGGGGGDASGAAEGAAAGAGDEAAVANESTAAASDGGTGAAEAVAATDAAVEADRQATVASSGIDSDSPSALFGDAVPPDAASSTASAGATTSGSSTPPDLESVSSVGSDSSFGQESNSFSNDSGFSEETNFSNDEPTFQDDFSTDKIFDEQPSSAQDDGFGDVDNTTVEGLGGEEASGQGSSLLDFLWDFFTDGGDE